MSERERTLMIVEDDPGLQRQLKWALDGYRVVIAGDRAEALDALRRELPAVATLDLGLPPHPDGPTEGFATLEAILAARPTTKVIVATGNDERENAVRAIGMGAYDFCAKPVDGELLRLVIDRAFRLHDLEVTFETPAQARSDQAGADAAPPRAAILGAPEPIDAKPLPPGSPDALPPHD